MGDLRVLVQEGPGGPGPGKGQEKPGADPTVPAGREVVSGLGQSAEESDLPAVEWGPAPRPRSSVLSGPWVPARHRPAPVLWVSVANRRPPAGPAAPPADAFGSASGGGAWGGEASPS